jgi:hypothetical protein
MTSMLQGYYPMKYLVAAACVPPLASRYLGGIVIRHFTQLSRNSAVL